MLLLLLMETFLLGRMHCLQIQKKQWREVHLVFPGMALQFMSSLSETTAQNPFIWFQSVIYQLYPYVVATVLHIPLCLKMGTYVLCHQSSGIFSALKIALRRLTCSCMPKSPKLFHTSVRILSGPVALPFFLLLKAMLTSSSEMSWTLA